MLNQNSNKNPVKSDKTQTGQAQTIVTEALGAMGASLPTQDQTGPQAASRLGAQLSAYLADLKHQSASGLGASQREYKNYMSNPHKTRRQFVKWRQLQIKKSISGEEGTQLSQEQFERLRLESEFLGTLDFFNGVKEHVLKPLTSMKANMADRAMDNFYFDRSFFRRPRPNPNLNPLQTFERNIKFEQLQRRRMKQKHFIKLVNVCNREFEDFHKKKNSKQKKTALLAKVALEQSLKRQNSTQDEDKKIRIQFIKSQNYKEYIKLIEKAKDERIRGLLAETDMFLKEIRDKLIKSKAIANGEEVEQREEQREEQEEKEYDVKKSAFLMENYKEMYYNFTHSKREEIKTQPSLLKGGTLKNYQLSGLAWLVDLYVNRLNGILADEMGLGKTIQTIALFCYIMEHKQNFGPFLIVVPLTTLTNWDIEFQKWAPSIKRIIYKGKPADRKKIAAVLRTRKFNVCLTTYEYVLMDKSELNRFHWQYIVVDEGHKMKNPKSKFAQTLGVHYTSHYRLLLTGTPLQNNLPELWSLLNFLLPKVFSSCEDFERWFKMPMKRMGCEQEIELNEEEKLLIVHRFHQVLRPFLLRRVKKEVESELPQKLEFIIKVELSGWQKTLYNQIFRKKQGENGKRKRYANPVNNMIMQLRKVCNHPYLFEESYLENENTMRVSGKFELLDRIIPKLIKTGHRMLIFTQMTQLIDILEYFLKYRGIKLLRLDGATKLEERAMRVAEFNRENSQYSVFLLSTRAGGLGLNLQSADTVILFDSDWNPQMDLQAQDRAHRIGTMKEVRVFRLITNGTIEENILSKASYKKNLDEMIIQAGMYNNKSTDIERRQRLQEIIKKTDLDMNQFEIPGDQEINRMLARDEEEYLLFEKFDQMRYDQEKIIYGQRFSHTKNYRLMAEDEVPERIKTKKQKKKVILGKRRNYRQFYNVEPEVNDEISESPKKRKRKGKRKGRGNRKKEGVLGNGVGNGVNGGMKGIPKAMAQNDDIFVDSDE